MLSVLVGLAEVSPGSWLRPQIPSFFMTSSLSRSQVTMPLSPHNTFVLPQGKRTTTIQTSQRPVPSPYTPRYQIAQSEGIQFLFKSFLPHH